MGLAIAFSIASFVQMVLLLVMLRKRIGYLDDKTIIVSVLKIITISAMMGAIVYAAKYIINLGINLETFIGVFIQGAGAGIIGIISYLILAMVFRCGEISIITQWLRKAKNQFFNGNKANTNNHE